MGKQRRGSRRESEVAAAARDYLFEMEPELQHIEAVAALLRILAEAQDSIEPIALSELAHLSGEAVDRITTSWRLAMDALRDQPGNPE